MFITFCAILISLFMTVYPSVSLDFSAVHLSVMIAVGGTSVFLASIFLNTFVLMPLQYLEQKLIPNVMELLQRDLPLRLGRIYLLLFVLISAVSFTIISSIPPLNQQWIFFIWIILFGLALDILRDSWRRFVNFLNPAFVVSQLSQRAKSAIQNDNKDVMLNDLNNLAEIGLHAVEKSKLALSTQVLQTLPPLFKMFFDSAKSIGHTSPQMLDPKNEKGGDTSNYVIFYLMQRLELINDKALRERQETVCRQMIMTLGKIIIHCSQFDLSMVSFPTHFLTKFGLKAQQHYFDEVTVLTTSTLLEVAKTILAEVETTYTELQDPFQSIINGLAAIARATFKKEKETSIKVLVQPLVDLQALFRSEKMVHYRDTPAILKRIDDVLEEFSILQQVMQSIPAISGMRTAEGSVPTP